DEHPSKYRCMLSFGWDKDIKNNCNFVWILRQYLVRKRLCRRVAMYWSGFDTSRKWDGSA
ncbi:MAG: hypothetical protein WC868_06945, partial [Bacteroidales bacterium]